MIKKVFSARMLRCVGMTLCALIVCFNSGEQMKQVREIGSSISISELSALQNSLSGILSLTIENGEDSLTVTSDLSETLKDKQGTAGIMLFGKIPIKEIEYSERHHTLVMPGGMSIGMSIYADGALVVGLGSISENNNVCPAAEAGIKPGDVITAVNGQEVTNSKQLGELCGGKGDAIQLTVRRNGQTADYTVSPAYDDAAEAYKVGMWVRDSSSGIGTLSFCNMETGSFGALGHPVTDIDTGSIIPVKSGNVIASSVIGVSAGSRGIPGEIIGSFSLKGRKIGKIEINDKFGIYGSVVEMPVNHIYPEGLPAAFTDEIHEGEAEILSTIDENGVRSFSCRIIKVYAHGESQGKNMVIEVTDPELIKKTGGIVQGMSGSPIIQGGKLVGAVTHVLVNDPTRGYGIFIENMLKAVE